MPIRPGKNRTSQIRREYILCPPLVPRIHALRKNIQVFLICHIGRIIPHGAAGGARPEARIIGGLRVSQHSSSSQTNKPPRAVLL
jgi:hypothetical protein